MLKRFPYVEIFILHRNISFFFANEENCALYCTTATTRQNCKTFWKECILEMLYEVILSTQIYTKIKYCCKQFSFETPLFLKIIFSMNINMDEKLYVGENFDA